MIDDSCEVPREDLDDGFNPCRKQVVENGELEAYAHMYDVMNERYDREEDTSYLDSVKRDKITSTTPVLLAGNNTQIYANSTNGEGRVNMLSSSAFNNPDNHTEASIPSAKAVADYVTANISPLEAEIEGKLDKVSSKFVVDRLYGVAPDGTQMMKNISSESRNIISGNKDLQTAGSIADYVPIPLPVSKGGTGGNTPYVTDDLDSSAIFVMHDAPNDRYDAAPMSALRNYLTTQFMSFDNELIPEGADLNTYKEPGNYSARYASSVLTVVNKPNDVTMAFNLYVVPILSTSKYTAQYLVEYKGGGTYYRHYYSDEGWASWNRLYPADKLIMDYVDGSLVRYNSIVVSGGTSKLVYNKVRFRNNRIFGDCGFTVDSEGGNGDVYIKINGTDINISPVFTKFILSNKPMLVHKSSNTIIEGKNIYNITNGTVYIQFNKGNINTGEFIFIVDSVFAGYNQPT